MVPPDDVAGGLRIDDFLEGRRPGEVGEQDGHRLAGRTLHGGGSELGAEWGAAALAEPCGRTDGDAARTARSIQRRAATLAEAGVRFVGCSA